MDDENFFSDENFETETAQQPLQSTAPVIQEADFNSLKTSYEDLNNKFQQQSQVIEKLGSVFNPQSQNQSETDKFNQYVLSLVDQNLKSQGYLTQAELHLNSTTKELGFVNPKAAENYYGFHVSTILNDPTATPQEIATAEQILNMWNNPSTQATALQLAGQMYGKPPSRGKSQQIGQSQTFGHQPSAGQQQTSKPFESEAEFEKAFYDPSHAKYKLANQLNNKMRRGEIQESPY